MKNEDRYIWLSGEIVPVSDAKISILSPTAQFGANVFEGIRCYWNEQHQQLYAFRLHDHYLRLLRSIRLFQIECPYSINEMKNALVDVVKANNYREDIAVRQTVFLDGYGSWSSKSPVNMFVAPIPKNKTSLEYNKSSLICKISSWQRIHENAISPRIKCGANYINSRMAQLEARRDGFDTAIFLNQNGHIAEAPGSCVFMVKSGKLVTPLLTDSVLESITRDTIIQVSRDLGIPVEERTIDRTELYCCDEAFLCGSSMEITPIKAIDGFEILHESECSITQLIHQEYLKIVNNLREFNQDWITPIY
jgi:branched-chain amino acid aminotransferase